MKKFFFFNFFLSDVDVWFGDLNNAICWDVEIPEDLDLSLDCGGKYFSSTLSLPK